MSNKTIYKIRAIKIGWLNEEMYHLLLRKENQLNRFMQGIKAIVFIINIIATAAGEDINYRWWTITTSIIIAFDAYINKIKDEALYGSKIELHRSMVDECIKFNDLLTSNKPNEDMIESAYNSLVEKASKLHIDPHLFSVWEGEFKKRGIKELNAFEITAELSKELVGDEKIIKRINSQYSPRVNNPPSTTTANQVKDKKAEFELQLLFSNLNNKPDE
jgi:hypothetical protein